MDRNDERDRDEWRDAQRQVTEQREERRPPRRDREYPPEVVQDSLDPKLLKSGKRAYRTDAGDGVYEVVDWGIATIDGKCRAVRLKPVDGTRGRTEWVSARYVRLATGDEA